MRPRPVGWSRWHADAFQDTDVAMAYTYRAPYPNEIFTTLAGLLDAESDAALDIGCGRGELARRMIDYAGRVDAVDVSAEMLAYGKALPGGDSPRLMWIEGRIEEATLRPPYGLVTAGRSLHWMEWDVVLPRLCDVLTERGSLAIVDCDALPAPWDDEMNEIISRYSVNKDFQRVDLIQELESRELFVKLGELRTVPMPFSQPVEEAIEAYHSMSALTRARMGPADACAFDAAARALFSRYTLDSIARWNVAASVVWGRPQRCRPIHISAPPRQEHGDLC